MLYALKLRCESNTKSHWQFALFKVVVYVSFMVPIQCQNLLD